MHNYSMWGGQFLLQTCPLWCHLFLLHAKKDYPFVEKTKIKTRKKKQKQINLHKKKKWEKCWKQRKETYYIRRKMPSKKGLYKKIKKEKERKIKRNKGKKVGEKTMKFFFKKKFLQIFLLLSLLKKKSEFKKRWESTYMPH